MTDEGNKKLCDVPCAVPFHAPPLSQQLKMTSKDSSMAKGREREKKATTKRERKKPFIWDSVWFRIKNRRPLNGIRVQNTAHRLFAISLLILSDQNSSYTPNEIKFRINII